MEAAVKADRFMVYRSNVALNEYKYGVVNSKGEYIVRIEYDKADMMFLPKTFIIIKKDEQYMAFDINGKKINESSYDNISASDDSDKEWFRIETKGKTGWVDFEGKEHWDD